MNRLIIPLAVAALAALAWLMLRTPVEVAPQVGAPDAGGTAAARPRALPALAEPLDASAPEPDGAVTLETVSRVGLLGLEARWLEQRMNMNPDWTRDGDAWIGRNQERLIWIVEGGRVRGAEVTFRDGAFSGELTALSSYFLGSEEPLPLHWEAPPPDYAGEPITGSFESQRGRRLYYRGTMRYEGDPPYGPATFEISTRPFPP